MELSTEKALFIAHTNNKAMHAITNSFSREISRHFDSYFEEYNLATSYIELILLVWKEGEISQKELAKRMNLAPSTITRFVQKLVKSGFVEKNKDGRIVSIKLTNNAKATAQKMHSSYKKAVQDLKEKLGEKFVSTTEQLLEHGTSLLVEDHTES
ncbi:MAG: MarR family transcriptional regulator [Balneolaceae bacterium]|nr:MAG: MarR family transcriptional regulator [Balneolaceae bacterium]